jgi:N-acetylglucosamine-6-phosphate deacetylase
MDQGLRNLVQMGEFSLTDAVIMASTAPAASLDLADGRGRLRPGARADLVVLNQDLSVSAVWIGGKKVV